MSDCFWNLIGACEDRCKCAKYLSFNSDEGRVMEEKYSRDIEQAIQPIKDEYKRIFNSKELE